MEAPTTWYKIHNLIHRSSISKNRIGIGPKPQGMDAADYVLSNFSEENS